MNSTMMMKRSQMVSASTAPIDMLNLSTTAWLQPISVLRSSEHLFSLVLSVTEQRNRPNSLQCLRNISSPLDVHIHSSRNQTQMQGQAPKKPICTALNLSLPISLNWLRIRLCTHVSRHTTIGYDYIGLLLLE